eukprot:Plantae.Rhodophyta-Rhodochaete_pulchella.ctg22927.p1 GENE.Plantae.Rhodophyta-Rhodochaete_pulchella.ctg22927~~Plantae.Rhodophyta-Rhodochaete_pulchella.ctg22927.p1  ORF type:complete len:419 (-),score=79.09 Plantae.Rhodophyta-Rhodochaete_pulchella.ctg22927:68-1324(-)
MQATEETGLLASKDSYNSQRPSYDSAPDVRKMSSIAWSERPTGQLAHKKNMTIEDRARGITEGIENYSSWLNILLIFVPLGIGSGIVGASQTFVFTSNFLGIIPLAMILGRATEDIASYTNDTVGGLLNATFGNAVEVILTIQALRQGLMDIIKATLVGSILSNLLLVMGFSFLCGGMLFREQFVKKAIAESNGSVLMMAVFGFVIPTLYQVAGSTNFSPANAERVSLVTSVCLLVLYALYLVYQLWTHADLYEGEHEEEEEDGAIATLPVAVVILLVSCLLVAKCSDYLVESVEGFSEKVGMNPSFIALILLPIVGNAAEHMSAVSVAMKDKMDLSIGIAVGSSVQIAIFVAPFLVLISWIGGFQHLTLDFEVFSTTCVVLSVLLVNTILRDLSTNWLEGAVLLAAYVMVAGAVAYL